MSTEIANGHVLSNSRLPVKLRNLLILREIIFFLYLARFTVARRRSVTVTVAHYNEIEP